MRRQSCKYWTCTASLSIAASPKTVTQNHVHLRTEQEDMVSNKVQQLTGFCTAVVGVLDMHSALVGLQQRTALKATAAVLDIPVVGVLDPHSKLVAVMELLLKGRLHGLRMQDRGTEKRQFCCLIICQHRNRPCTLD